MPAGLIALSIVPILAGAVRLKQLAIGFETVENRRFFQSPLPVVLHVTAIVLFSLLGALQFAPGLRRRFPRWHRCSGRVVTVAGIIAALSGLWMAQFYALPAKDGLVLYLMRLAVGGWMLWSLSAGFLAARARRIAAHQDWMLRGYAVGMGAGTQVITGIPTILLFGPPNLVSQAALMGTGWAINLLFAEWVINRRRNPTARLA